MGGMGGNFIKVERIIYLAYQSLRGEGGEGIKEHSTTIITLPS
jgi:hypothetical protein